MYVATRWVAGSAESRSASAPTSVALMIYLFIESTGPTEFHTVSRHGGFPWRGGEGEGGRGGGGGREGGVLLKKCGDSEIMCLLILIPKQAMEGSAGILSNLTSSIYTCIQYMTSCSFT